MKKILFCFLFLLSSCFTQQDQVFKVGNKVYKSEQELVENEAIDINNLFQQMFIAKRACAKFILGDEAVNKVKLLNDSQLLFEMKIYGANKDKKKLITEIFEEKRKKFPKDKKFIDACESIWFKTPKDYLFIPMDDPYWIFVKDAMNKQQQTK